VVEAKKRQTPSAAGNRLRGDATLAGTHGVLNDAVSIYFLDPALAGAFVARWCIGYKVETPEGAFRVREDEPAPRVGAGLHGTP
jgi:hypothetical protein